MFRDELFVIKCNLSRLLMICTGECDFLAMIYPLYFQFQSNITTGLLFGGQAKLASFTLRPNIN